MVRARWRMLGRFVSAGVRGRRPTDGGVTWFSFGLRRPNRGAALLILARDFSQRIARTTRKECARIFSVCEEDAAGGVVRPLRTTTTQPKDKRRLPGQLVNTSPLIGSHA
ncbi:unnamed protein product, partial [Brenthis ino]